MNTARTAEERRAARGIVARAQRRWDNCLLDLFPAPVWVRYSRALWRKCGRPAVAVAFHRVEENPEDDLSVSPQTFRALCRHWKQYYEITSLGELVRFAEERPTERKDETTPKLAITFDDGYRDNAEIAAPILAELGLPATFFVTTGFVGTGKVFEWDRRKHARKHPNMSWAEVEKLERKGFTVGAHTHNHPRLSQVVADEAEIEIRRAMEILRTRVTRPAPDFAYPFGGPEDCDAKTRNILKHLGFRSCFSCHGGLIERGDDPFELKRVPISPRFHQTPAAWEYAFSILLRQAERRGLQARQAAA
jgi:peptidoglycan/xylan/chitin deacetylase (PgdA/CDA1 family)